MTLHQQSEQTANKPRRPSMLERADQTSRSGQVQLLLVLWLSLRQPGDVHLWSAQIASRIEVFIAPPEAHSSDRPPHWKRLGFLSLDPNEQSGHQVHCCNESYLWHRSGRDYVLRENR